MSEFNKKDDFLLNHILNESTKNNIFGSKEPNGDSHEKNKKRSSVRPSHALTPEEVIGRKASSEDHNALGFSLPLSAQEKGKPEFIVFESNIKPEILPDLGEKKINFSLSGIDFQKKNPEPKSPPENKPVFENTNQSSEPKISVKEEKIIPKKQTQKILPPVPQTSSFSLKEESFYERMKKLQQNTATPQETKGTSSTSANLMETSSTGKVNSPTGPVLKQTPPSNFSRAPKPVKIIDSVKQFIAEEPNPVVTSHLLHKSMSEMTVEELIKYAEEKAEKRIENTYHPQMQSMPFKPASYFENKVTPAAKTGISTDPVTVQKSAVIKPKPVETASQKKQPDPVQNKNTGSNIVAIQNIDAIPKETKKYPVPEPTASENYSKQTIKVTPVKRSRVFTTPATPDVTTPATKVLAKEVHVNVDLVDKSLKESFEDHRIKEHNPYASQYSLADAGLPKKSPGLAVSDTDTEEDEVDIISSTKNSEKNLESTVAFDHNFSDFDIDKILPAEHPHSKNKQAHSAKKLNLFGGNEPENAPEEIPYKKLLEDTADESVLSDYETIGDKEAVETDLSSKLFGIVGRLVFTVLITIALFVLSSPIVNSFVVLTPATVYITGLALLAVAAIINFRTMKGFWSLITLRPDFDSPAALTVLVVLVQAIVSMSLGGNTENILIALGGLVLTSNLIGKFLTLRTIGGNFKKIANERTKKSVILLDDPDITAPIAGGSVLGEALIFSGKNIKQAKNFLKNSYKRDPYETTVSKILLIGILISAIIGGIGAIQVNPVFGVTAFAAILCLCCPPSSFLLSTLPLYLANKKLNKLGAEIASYDDAKNFSYSNAITIDAEDLFPKGSVNLFNMHILSPHPIDQSILEAAAITEAIKSPLAQIFDGMITEDMTLPIVDTITYENKMGVSGWVGEKRIFIGNRTLMETHGIPLPSLDVDKRILKSGYFPVYLASTEGPAALFIVGYEADEEISYQLRRLSATGVTLLVHTCDQNINEDMVCDYFELYPESVKVLSPQISNLYKTVTKPQEDGNSAAVVLGNAAGFSAVLTACIRIKENYTASLVLHIIGLCLGMALVALLAINQSLTFASAIFLGSFQIVCSVIIALISIFRRP